MTPTSADGRWQILTHERSDNSYMGSERDRYWFLVSVELGDELVSWSGSVFADAGGRSVDGTVDVGFDGAAVVARDAHGAEERVALPARVALGDDGASLVIDWPDGRQETRPRRAAIAVGKYGNPIELRPLVGER